MKKKINFIPFECEFCTADIALAKLSYSRGGNLAVIAYEADGDCLEPFATLTVNLAEWAYLLQRNQAFVDTNNCPGIDRWLTRHGIATPTGLNAYSGYCEYPMMTFNLDRLNSKDDFVQAGFSY